MKSVVKILLVILYFSIGIPSAKAEWRPIEEVCEWMTSQGKTSSLCNSPTVFVKTGRSLFGSFSTMAGKIEELYYNSARRVTKMRLRIHRSDTAHRTSCWDMKLGGWPLEMLEFGESVNTLATVHPC